MINKLYNFAFFAENCNQDKTFVVEKIGSGYCINQVTPYGESEAVDYVSYKSIEDAIDGARILGITITDVA